jgi:spore maturation protein CgeB
VHPDLNILLVSDFAKFALTDVFNGYLTALKALNIKHEFYPMHSIREFYSNDKCISLMHSNAVRTDKKFTHVIFIGGLNIPRYVLESLYNVKSVIISTEDPHTCSPLLDNLDVIDYYFSNERSIGLSSKYANTYYCPTAGDSKNCGAIHEDFIEDKYKSDVLFLGAMYPNRVKLLEESLPFIKKNNINLKLCGHMMYMPEDTPLWEYVDRSETIRHEETVKYYNGAKIVLNMFRDIEWNPRTNDECNPHNKDNFEAESMNPRCYEVPLCQSLLMTDNSRPEVREVFQEDEVATFEDGIDLSDKLEYFLLGDGKDLRQKMAMKAFFKVSTQHTYTHRLNKILSIID